MSGNPYANIGAANSGGASGANPYARIGSSGGGASASAGKRKGLLGTLSRIPGAAASDLYNAAVETPAALVEIHHALAKADPSNPRHFGHSDTSGLKKLGGAYVQQTKETVEHPLRHPGITALTVVPFVGQVGKVAEAGVAATRAAKAGESVTAAAKAASKTERTIKVGDSTARGHYSRAASGRVAQKTADATLNAAARQSRVAENLLHRRAAKWNERNLRVKEAVARAPGTRVQALGHKLKPEELRAARLVADEVPVARRLGAQEMRKARAKGREVGRHQDRIDLTRKAMAYLDEGPDGKPVFKDTATRARRFYSAVQSASKDRGEALSTLKLLDEEAQQLAKTKAARFAAGATTSRVKGTKQLALVGAEDISVSRDAPFIGNPVQRGRMTGRPTVSSRSTFGHRQKPGSLKIATGGSVEHATERLDIHNVVAERHAESVSLADTARRVEMVKGAGTKAPTRRDDVWMWTDKTVASTRVPAEVRRFLDHPEDIAKLPEGEQHSIREQIRSATFEHHNWEADSEARAEFEKLAEKGQGVFVPRRMLGDAGKRNPNIAAVPGVAAVDAINNAQKAALVYLKVSYTIVQAVSNVAMNLIHEGFAAPTNLAKAAMLSHTIGPEYAAVVDDIMGQGAVQQAAFHGGGAVAHASQKLAGFMSRGVDKPSRRAAFLHEARKAGANTPEKLKALLEDDRQANKLAEVAQRAKEAIVDYGELGPTERQIIRRLVFVYPWQKGSTKYAAYFFRDHPVQAAALGLLGQRGAQIRDETLGPVPSYLRGSFDVGGKLVNPAGVNFFQTPAQIGLMAAGYATGKNATPTGMDMLSPAPGALVAAITKRDQFGRRYGKPLPALQQQFVSGVPVVEAAKSLAGRGHTSQTFPNQNDPRWRFLFGGLYPRQYDKGALNKNAARERTGR